MTSKTVEALLQYCSDSGIKIHSAISPKQVPGAGLGVYTNRKVKSGECLVQVPTKHIFSPDSIPTSFLSFSARRDIAVHAQLAAFFAFSDKEDLRRYQPWLATWPDLSDFTDGMPIFWGPWAEQLLEGLGRTSNMASSYAPKRRKVSIDSGETTYRRTSRFETRTNVASIKLPSLSPAISGTYTTSTSHSPSASLLHKMTEKLIVHIQSIDTALPHLNLINDDHQLTKFLHAWCLVNTRCFYYISPTNPRGKPKPPSDPNEAMALCPFMDLFNHRAPSSSPEHATMPLPCKVPLTPAGFTVTTASAIPADTEVTLSYGAHTNDTLWTEYGFLLSGTTNSADAISLDEIVLGSPGLKVAEKATLQEHGYLGEYTLWNDGSTCYRTEMVAWLLVLGRRKWTKVVVEGMDPEESCTSPSGKAMFVALLAGWLGGVSDAAQRNFRMLREMQDTELLWTFGTMSVVESVHSRTEEQKMDTAKRRKDMCLVRWEQIRGMTGRAIELLTRDDG